MISVAETSVDGGCVCVWFFFFLFYLSECLKKTCSCSFTCWVSVLWLLPFNNLELAGEMREFARLEVCNKKVNLDFTLHICDSLLQRNFTCPRKLIAFTELGKHSALPTNFSLWRNVLKSLIHQIIKAVSNWGRVYRNDN